MTDELINSTNKEIDPAKRDKFLKKAIKSYSKAEKLVSKSKFKKAEWHFQNSINTFLQLNNKNRAEKVLLKLAECFLIEKQYQSASNTMRDAANLRLMDFKFINAIEQYQSVIELLLKIDESRGNLSKILEIGSFISLCYLAVGDFNKSTDYLKRNIRKYSNDIKNKSKIKILQHTVDLNNIILKKDKDELAELKSIISKLNLRDGEKILFQQVYEILRVYINSTIELNTNISEIRAGDEFLITGKLISENNVKIKSIDLYLDHGFTYISDPEILDNNLEFNSRLISKISGKFKININLVCETENFIFPLIGKKMIEISQGYPIIQLFINMENIISKIEEPLTLEYSIKNIGRGEATNLKLKVEIPPTVKLIEGTLVKQLHSLAPQEEFPFIYRFKGIVIGKHNIISTLSWGSGNSSEKFSDIYKELDIEIIN